MDVKTFVKRLQKTMPQRAWGRLKAFAKRGLIKWGDYFAAAGPVKGPGG